MYQDKKTTGDVVRQVIQFAGDDYQGIEEVARRLCMSSRTLRRKLTAEGISYQEIIDDIRKDNAIELLENTGDSIEIISEKIGYCNTSNFYHAFKRWTGQTPGKYRISKKSSAKSKTGANLNSWIFLFNRWFYWLKRWCGCRFFGLYRIWSILYLID